MRRSDANHVTAIIPYFGYARQDSSSNGRKAIGARLIADLLRTAGIGRAVAVDLHSRSSESAFATGLEHLTSVRLLSDALTLPPRDAVLVAADMAALALTERYGRTLNLPIAIIATVRLSDQEVVARNLIGDVRGRSPIIVDDIIISGRTIEAAHKAVVAAGAIPNNYRRGQSRLVR